MLPATFELAFAGNRNDSVETMDVSSTGLLLKLLDKKVINKQQCQLVKVSVLFLCGFLCLHQVFYVMLQLSIIILCLVICHLYRARIVLAKEDYLSHMYFFSIKH